MSRMIYMGTALMAVAPLKALLEDGHEVAAVYTQPPRPKGRSYALQKSSVHEAAEALGLPVYTPSSLRGAEAQEQLAQLRPEVIVLMAYGLLLPLAVLQIPPLGCINIHVSLLPRWRGASPLQRALWEGDAETGVTIMRMDEGLDTGPILLQESLPITEDMTLPLLEAAESALGAKLIVKALDLLQKGELEEKTQPQEGILYAEKLTREDGRLDWSQTAARLARQVRALNPWPSTFFQLNDEVIKVLDATAVEGAREAPAGTLLDQNMTIACGQGALRLLRLQRAGKAAAPAADVLRGLRLAAGFRFS